MTDSYAGTTPGWGIVRLTNIPGGQIYPRIAGEVRALGHRIIGVLTSPGPERRPSDGYPDVVAPVPPGVDVIVSNHPARWAVMLAAFQPDLICNPGNGSSATCADSAQPSHQPRAYPASSGVQTTGGSGKPKSVMRYGVSLITPNFGRDGSSSPIAE